MLPLQINHSIVPELEIEKFQRTRPLIVSAKVFESVIAELIEKHREEINKFELKVSELEYQLDESVSTEELDEEVDLREQTEKELKEKEDELETLKANIAEYVARNPEVMEEFANFISGYNLEELVDEYGS